MSPLPNVRAKDFIKVIEKLGFVFDRQKGSHAVYKHTDGRRVVIPIHQGKDIKKGTLMAMLQDIDLDKESFIKMLKS